ncbi:unnamed protein product [Phyllotreta striolata]|uniref:Uncharacterized protein n=1 Tax=Phyllotreta striolata TaxID=444603 RepID=A0A9N9THK4_PHYSR|nr:unnamed protein product [Phyllotreta striolata]
MIAAFVALISVLFIATPQVSGAPKHHYDYNDYVSYEKEPTLLCTFLNCKHSKGKIGGVIQGAASFVPGPKLKQFVPTLTADGEAQWDVAVKLRE